MHKVETIQFYYLSSVETPWHDCSEGKEDLDESAELGVGEQLSSLSGDQECQLGAATVSAQGCGCHSARMALALKLVGAWAARASGSWHLRRR